MSKKETIEQFNQRLDEIIQHKNTTNGSRTNEDLLGFAHELQNIDFSHESHIRHDLRDRLLNTLQSHRINGDNNSRKQSPATINVHSKYNRRWLSATLLASLTILMIIMFVFLTNQSSRSPLYSAPIQQDNTQTQNGGSLISATITIDSTLSVIQTISDQVEEGLDDESAIDSSTPSTNQQNLWVAVIATENIPEGTTLTADMLSIAYFQQDDVLTNRSLGFSSIENLIGLQVLEPIAQWSPIQITNISYPRETEERDHVVVAMPVSQIAYSEAAEFGSKVDILIVRNRSDTTQIEATPFMITSEPNRPEGQRGQFIFPVYPARTLESHIPDGIIISTPDSSLPTPFILQGTSFIILTTPTPDFSLYLDDQIATDATILWNGAIRSKEACTYPTSSATYTYSDDSTKLSINYFPCLMLISVANEDAIDLINAIDDQIPLAITLHNDED